MVYISSGMIIEFIAIARTLCCGCDIVLLLRQVRHFFLSIFSDLFNVKYRFIVIIFVVK